MAKKKHLVLQHHQHAHELYPQHNHPAHAAHQQQAQHDAWHQFEGLVFVLIFIHMAAFAFWCWLLYKSRASKAAAAAENGGRGSSGGRQALAGGAPRPGAAAAGEGRTTRDILKAYQKAQLGKA
jgi:hypothetical protein